MYLNLKEGGVFIFDENLDEPLSIIIQDKKIAEATLKKNLTRVAKSTKVMVKITKILQPLY